MSSTTMLGTERDLPKLLDPAVDDDPAAFYRRLRTDHPLHRDDSVGALLVTRYADVIAAYRNPGVSTANYAWQLEPVMGVMLLQLEGVGHSRIRKIMMPYFRGDGLARTTLLPRSDGGDGRADDHSPGVDGQVPAHAARRRVPPDEQRDQDAFAYRISRDPVMRGSCRATTVHVMLHIVK